MKKALKSFFAAAIALALCASLIPQQASAYSPPTTTVRAGLRYGSSSVDSANLENEVGSGYEFGYYDSSRNFVSFGVSTGERQITIMRDSNMSYSSSDNSYYRGTSGSVVVGCYHVQISSSYPSYDAARSAASSYSDSFVKYDRGNFVVCVGHYISDDAARNGAASRGISNYSVTSGTEYTVTVVKTGTSQILFEFDYGAERSLGVRPVSDGSKTITWFRGYSYYGGFQYSRLSGDSMTVVNFVNLEDYVKGVIPYEMSSSWPIEALKAQACCARTYVIDNLNSHTGFDVCTTEDCQVYYGTEQANETTNRAVDETAGQFVTYNGELCSTFYASSDGGATENCENVWVAALPYLRGVVDPYEADVADIIPGYRWKITYTADELKTRLANRGYLGYDSTIVNFEVSQRTAVGNVYSVRVTYLDGSGSTRSISFSKEDAKFIVGGNSLHFTINGDGGTSMPSPAPSPSPSPSPTAPVSVELYVNDSSSKISGTLESFFAIGAVSTEQLPSDEIYAIDGDGKIEMIAGRSGESSSGNESESGNESGGGIIDVGGSSGNSSNYPAGTYVVEGTGNGHNLGMSQWGAYSMAMYHNKTYEEIIKFYFTGVDIG